MGKCGSKPQVVASKQPPGKEPAPCCPCATSRRRARTPRPRATPRGDTPYMTFRGGAFIDEALARRAFRPPPPLGAEEPAESDPILDYELDDANAVRAQLTPAALDLAESHRSYHGLRRTLRGYWTYPAGQEKRERNSQLQRLRSRPFSTRTPDRVTEMVASLEKFEAFRRRFGLDELANDEPRARADCARLLNFWDNMKFCGYDAYGHPVITETVHETLARVNLADEDPEDLLKGRTVCTEAFIALKHLATRRHNSDVTVLKQGGKSVLKQVLIVDMDRVRLRMVTSRVRSRFKVIMKTLEDVYPEVAWRTYVVNSHWLISTQVVNAPGYLRVIWTVVKSWLHPTTAMKMLADGVPEDAVPASCGGGAVEVSLADLFAGSPELAAAYGASAAEPRGAARRAAARAQGAVGREEGRARGRGGRVDDGRLASRRSRSRSPRGTRRNSRTTGVLRWTVPAWSRK
ncbi:hypothetical protein JL721_8572 [Aureococcus anophagefferens]|nr:hypothetical protein JL721_8572 [Aureococcus anophagefferens]